ncbi:hypothetical protein BDW02DRAFT_569726 [Decorospora gaudefroyi]|uniref:C3H1-type domain-containing protein n=1 Tax=Decorospora gaudefroyi TaxID=184978 RepID=A0A6A5KGY7_9PLEO|nr:hypothetical protein BDW02DRAFT_569726 [Decorospora gaudefroyi]
MLADGKIDSLDTHLEQFKLNDQTRQVDLQNLLKEYSQLLDDYKVLKKAYEDKDVKGGSKAIATPTVPMLAAAKPRNPYVLVLVDGNDYIFNDELIREKEEGGMRAARMLNDAVEKYLQQSVPQARTARVIVRIYADLTNLSKQLAKSRLIGLEKRSISPFSAAFTRAISLFDFVDALDEEGTKFKIREQFKLASEDTACSHILYAACRDAAYLSQLVPYSGVREKITLVQGAGWNPEFHQFNLNVTQFPTIFRWSDLPVTTPIKGSTPMAPKQKAAVQKPMGPSAPARDSWRRESSMSVTDSAFGTDVFNNLSPPHTNGFGEHDRVGWENRSAYTQHPKNTQQDAQKDTQLCKYFQKGFCRYGNKCNFQHIPKGFDGINGSSTHPAPASSRASPATTTDRTNISSALPNSIIPGFIPLNKNAQRLDMYLTPPTDHEWKIYNTRFHKSKPCNAFHLQRICATFACPYDHSELEPEAKRVLQYVLKCAPCPRKGRCRVADCCYGHVCIKEGCVGLAKGCRMKAELHYVVEECQVSSLVPVDDEGEEKPEEGGVGVGVGEWDGMGQGHPLW